MTLYDASMPRKLTAEFMDAPDASRKELAEALRYLRWVNRWLGGRWGLVSSLERWSRHWKAGESVTLLDVATGSADLAVEARRWGLARGFDLRVTGIDIHPTTLALAREHVAGVGGEVAEGIELVECDAKKLVERFGVGSFDYVHAGLFLHHLPDIEVMTVLAIMDRVSRRGVVWNDLVRSPLSLGFVRLLTIGQDAMVKHDAVVSMQAGFTKGEAMDLARRAGLERVEYRTSLLSHRFALTAGKHSAMRH